MHVEDESGRRDLTFATLCRDANRLSMRSPPRRCARRPGRDRAAAARRDGDRDLALYQMGAVAMPLSILFGPEALAFRLRDSGAVARSAMALGRVLAQLRAQCPELAHLITVAAPVAGGLHWSVFLAHARDEFAS